MAPSPTRLLLTAGTLLTWLPALSFLFNHVGRTATVDGRSMSPFLNTDYQETGLRRDRVWLSLWNPSTGVRRGMVVAFWSPSRPEIMAVKRVIALEGDSVRTKSPYPLAEEKVPPGHVWLEGDHAESNDSNTYGPVPVALLVGKVKGVFWPWSKAGWIRWQDWRGSGRVREASGVNPCEGGEGGECLEGRVQVRYVEEVKSIH